jgi:hypothetical protein
MGWVKDNPPSADHSQLPWGIGKLECWNTGHSGMGSFIRVMALTKDDNQNIPRFSYPTFHFSIIPIFPSVSIGNHHPFGVKSKFDPLGRNSLRHLLVFLF